MKRIIIKSLINMTLIFITALAISACNDQPSQVHVGSPEPQVIVVTATSTAEFRIETKPGETVGAAESTPATFEAGSLLKGSGEGVFYLTETGTRRQFYDWDTFAAFGFAKQDILEVEDTVLADIPPAGELTQLVRGDEATLYWVLEGQRYQINQAEQWQDTVAQVEGFGVPASSLDADLMAILPKRESQIEGLDGKLNRETQAANLRSGPGLSYEIVGVVLDRQPFQIKGHTAVGDWLLVDFGELTGWLAADLVSEAEVARLFLPVIEATEVASNASNNLPRAQPAAMTESEATPQPVTCNEVPIRGFGQVWGDHPEVQQRLGCPSWPSEEQGTNVAVQTFQHGLMLWLESDSSYASDPVYVFFEDGSYQRFGDLGSADPAKVAAVPAGFYEVGDKFGKVYWEGTGVQVKERLGYPTGLAQESAGAFQQFYNGRMFWAETADQIYIIYDYSVYDAATERSVRIHTWESYEDKF